MRRNRLAAGVAIALALAVTGFRAGPAFAAGSDAPIACDASYDVAPGDTLASIAVRAYGTDDTRPLIEANRDVLSRPVLLFVGQRLFIPCSDGARAAQGAPGIQPAPSPSGGDRRGGQPVGPGPEARGARQDRADAAGGANPEAAAPAPTFQPMTPGPRPVLTAEIVPRPPAAGGRGTAPGASGGAATAGGAQTGSGAARVQRTPGRDATAARAEVQPRAGAGIQPAAGAAGGVQPPVTGRPVTGQSGSTAGGLQPAASGQRARAGRPASSAAGPAPASGGAQTAVAAPQPPAAAGIGTGEAGQRGADSTSQSAPTPARDADGIAATGGEQEAAPAAGAADRARPTAPVRATTGADAPTAAARRQAGARAGDAAGRTAAPVQEGETAPADPRSAQAGTGAGDPAADARGADAQGGPRVRPLPRTDRIATPRRDAGADGRGEGAPRIPTDSPAAESVSLAALDPAPRNAREPRTQGETDLRAPATDADAPAAAGRRGPAGGEAGPPPAAAADEAGASAQDPVGGDPDAGPAQDAAQTSPERGAVFGLPDGAGPVTARSPQSMGPAPGGVQPLPRILPTASDDDGAQAGAAGAATRVARTDPPAGSARAAGTAAPPALATGEAVRILSAAMPPYAGGSLPGRGMLAEMAVRALGHAAPGRPVRISFVGDRRLHLGVLLPDGAYDIGLPWLKPDCARPGRLSPDLRRRCAEFLWSDPLQEIVIGYVAVAGSALSAASAPADLAGRRLCRPADQPTLDLSQNGLVAGRVSLVAGRDAADCLDRLLAGAVDVVTMSLEPLEAEIARRGLEDRVEEIPALADRHTLHALAARDSAKGRAALALIDRGLATLRDTGEWFEVIARHRSDPLPGN